MLSIINAIQTNHNCFKLWSTMLLEIFASQSWDHRECTKKLSWEDELLLSYPRASSIKLYSFHTWMDCSCQLKFEKVQICQHLLKNVINVLYVAITRLPLPTITHILNSKRYICLYSYEQNSPFINQECHHKKKVKPPF